MSSLTNLSRRDFLFYSGATAAGITLGEAGRRLLARADEGNAGWRAGAIERWTVSTCRECAAGCGMRVRLIDGVPVKLEGNPVCPLSRGRLCAKGQASLESYFDPDRLVGPARSARRGNGLFESLTWAAAVDILAKRLALGDATPAERPIAIAAEEHGPLADAWAAFWTAAGARVVCTPAPTAARLHSAFQRITGVDRDPVFDIRHATHILSFDADIAQDWLSGVWSQRAFGQFRRGASQPRGRLVYVGAHRSATARKADEWFSASTAQQVVLAYGIASVILRENRAASTWPEDVPAGPAAFDESVIERYSPDMVASATGVPVVTLLRLARDLAGSLRPLILVAPDADPALIDAALMLNLMVGAFDRQGGVFASPGPSMPQSDDAGGVLREITAGSLKPRLIAFRDSSALRALSAPAEVQSALVNAGFVVSFSPFLDEAAAVADLLMPTDTSLESWHARRVPTTIPAEAFAVSRPAVAARLDTKDPVAALRLVADATGTPVTAWPWKSSQEVVTAELRRLYALRRGSPYSSDYETEWLRDLQRGGWWVPSAATAEQFQAQALDAGGWLDPFFEPGAIRESLRARGGAQLARPPASEPASESRASVALASMRGSEQPHDVHKPSLLKLVPFVPAAIGLHGGFNQPSLFELLAPPGAMPWGPWAELSPETARGFRIENGSRIVLTSSNGSIEVQAVLVEGMSPETVAVAFVPSNPQGGRWWRLVGGDLRSLWQHDACGGECFVRIARA